MPDYKYPFPPPMPPSPVHFTFHRPKPVALSIKGADFNLMPGMLYVGERKHHGVGVRSADKFVDYLYSSWEVLATGAMCRCRVGDRVIFFGTSANGPYEGAALDFICRESDVGAILDRDEDKAETEEKMDKQKKDAEDALFVGL